MTHAFAAWPQAFVPNGHIAGKGRTLRGGGRSCWSLRVRRRPGTAANVRCHSIWMEKWPAPRRPLPSRVRRDRRAGPCRTANPDRLGNDGPSQVAVTGEQQTGTVGRPPTGRGAQSHLALKVATGGGSSRGWSGRTGARRMSPPAGSVSTQIEKERPLVRRIGEIGKLAGLATGGCRATTLRETQEAGRALRATGSGAA
jgi:hypothetical protein